MTSTARNLTPTDIHGQLLKRANRIWRRTGVRSADRRTLRAELSRGLDAAAYAGRSATSIVGDDPQTMFRDWATERGVSGRALRYELVIPAALLGISAGLSVMLVAVAAAFTGHATTFDPGPFTLALYGSSSVLGFLCALVCTWLILKVWGDPHALATTRWLAILLPVGAVAATAAGVGIAWLQAFDTVPMTFATTTASVITVLVITIGIARHRAVNRPSKPVDTEGLSMVALPAKQP